MIHRHRLLVNIYKQLYPEQFMIMRQLFMKNWKAHDRINLIMMLMLYLDQLIHRLVLDFYILDFTNNIFIQSVFS